MGETPWVSGDTELLETDLLDGRDRAIPLTRADAVDMRVEDPDGAVTWVPCAIVDALAGRVRADDPVPEPLGLYLLRWRITWSDGSTRTVPTEEPERLRVIAA